MPCSQYESLFFSMAHSDSDIQATIKAAEDVLTGMA
jgi:glutamate-1-semialdehyde aminotransferase